jgi:hypothetical protein
VEVQIINECGSVEGLMRGKVKSCKSPTVLASYLFIPHDFPTPNLLPAVREFDDMFNSNTFSRGIGLACGSRKLPIHAVALNGTGLH